MIWRYFKRDEFTCKHCGENEIQKVFVDRLDALRGIVGFPLIVNSGYRCPVHDAAVGGAGPHTTGRAADLRVDRERALRVIVEAGRLGFTGFGVKQQGASRFLHLDDLPAEPGRPRPTIWSY